MQIFWEEVLRSVAEYSLPVLIIAYFVKKLIVHWLDKDISTFKQSLENTANKERLRLQISYGGIFEKQANALLDIYKALKDLLPYHSKNGQSRKHSTY